MSVVLLRQWKPLPLISRTPGGISKTNRPAQDAQLTTSELLALAAEEDGTRLGAQKSEEKRQKEEKWAMYTDEHKKGEGNTMNRG